MQVACLVHDIVRNLVVYAQQATELGLSTVNGNTLLLRPLFSWQLMDTLQSRRAGEKEVVTQTSAPPLGCLIHYLRSCVGSMEEALHLHNSLSYTLKNIGELTPADIEEVCLMEAQTA